MVASRPDRLSDRVTLITGGGSGIGRATALIAAREGAKVLVADVDEEAAAATARQIEGEGGHALDVACDVSVPAEVEVLFERINQELGRPTAVFNCAGIAIGKDALETSVEEFDRTMAVNVRSVWLCSRALIRGLDGEPGAIVNAASTNAFFAEPDIPVYSASKGAVLALTRAMAFDHAALGVRINCVCPGIIETGLVTPWLDEMDDPAAARRTIGAAHALNRLGTPEEIGSVVVFLLSDEASFVTGAAVVADGGLTIGKLTL